MKKLIINLEFEQYNNLNELNNSDASLFEAAIQAANTAYAPYSKFQVGAAVLLESGVIVKGSNQENAAYPSGLCAERVALFAAGSQYPGIKVKSIAVTVKGLNETISEPVSPCGDCRQVMAEFEHRFNSEIRLIMPAENGSILVCRNVRSLLPFMFNSDHLKEN
ncbi:MAG TPA: cytidine deaminase [Bacteroidia bacterium]|nr:cytidine deaminase [Bacteroidia bacterium]